MSALIAGASSAQTSGTPAAHPTQVTGPICPRRLPAPHDGEWETLPDHILTYFAAARDARALDLLFRRHWSFLYRCAARACGDPLAAEDILQEACAKVAGNIARLPAGADFRLWVTGHIYNEARHWKRNFKKVGTPALRVGIYILESMTVEPHNGAEENHIDSVYGRDLLQVLSNNAAIYSAGYGYDSNGRMGSVSSGVYSAAYGYTPNSDLLQTTTCKSNTATVLTTSRTWDYGYRLQRIANVANGAVVTSHSYSYDWLDRRIQASLEDGSVWKYNYNDRNELIGAHRYWADWMPVSGQQYGYDYDNIGNRNSASSGGDSNGGNLRTMWYIANLLNQYTNITTPGYEDILGAAVATNGVTVNSGSADRKGEYFHREISIANSSSPVWQTVSVTSGTATTNGGFAFPKNSQTLTYDLDGNLTFDGIWMYEWDPENRLVAMSMTNTLANLVNSKRLRLEFVYDFQGRRVSKAVKAWNGAEFADPVSTLFAYDGWNLLAAFSPQLSVLQSFLWGQDLSGTMTRAGGVCGLLGLFEGSNGQISSCHYAAYDGNGNLTALVRASDLLFTARYEYSPYGETLRGTGPTANANPFRFSTKFSDDGSGLVYYGARYFSPTLGRWPTRDPGGEGDGNNPYCFVGNSPIDRADRNGLDTYFCNRRISGDQALAPAGFLDAFVHGFIFTTDENGDIENTFSWGNNGGKRGWVGDALNDKTAAKKALDKGWAVHVGDRAFDALVKQAFEHLYGSPESKHTNWGIFGRNCRSEAWNLIHEAELYAEMEEDE